MSTAALRLNGLKLGPNDTSAYTPAFGAVGDGVANDATAIQNALNASGSGAVYLPAGSYLLGSTGLTVPSGRSLIGASRASVTITYTGTGSAITLDSIIGSCIRGIKLNVNSASATARGISVLNTTGNNEFNIIDDVAVQQTNTPTTPVVGQVGILLNATTTNGLYWNTIRNVVVSGWDSGVQLIGYASNAPNQNYVADVLGYACNYVLDINAYVNDTVAHGIRMSASGYASSVACVNVGDGTHTSQNNQINGIVADTGASGKAFKINANAVGTYVSADNESAPANIDNGTNTTKIEVYAANTIATFPSLVSRSPTADGASAVGFIADTAASWVNATAKIASFRTAGAEKANILANGGANFTGGIVQVAALQSSGNVLVATGGIYDSYNGSSTVNFCTANATTMNVGRAGCRTNFGGGTITQITSIATGVIVNASSGVITTFSAAVAAQATATFVVTNSCVAAGSVVNVALGAYSGTFGTNGTPIITVSAVAGGSFTVLIYNAHAANALNGTLKINFSVL